MKANHIPVRVRLTQRVKKLELREESCWRRVQGNPYLLCKHCFVSEVEESMGHKHGVGCPMRGLDKQIKYFKKLLQET